MNSAYALLVERALTLTGGKRSDYLACFYPEEAEGSRRDKKISALWRNNGAHELKAKYLKENAGGPYARLVYETTRREDSPLYDLTMRLTSGGARKNPFDDVGFQGDFTKALGDEFGENEAMDIPRLWNDYHDLKAKAQECVNDEDRLIFVAALVQLLFSAAILGPTSTDMRHLGITRNNRTGTLPSSSLISEAARQDTKIASARVELIDGVFDGANGFVISGRMRRSFAQDKSIIIGRDPSEKGVERVEIEGGNLAVSRSHIELTYSGGAWRVRNLSANGTIVIRDGETLLLSGREPQGMVLMTGDVLMLHQESRGFLVQPA